MLSSHLGPSADMPPWAVWLACALSICSFAMLLVELRRRERGGMAIVATGFVSLLALMFAVVRPARVSAREAMVGAKVVVLADVSRSMALPGDESLTRQEVRELALDRLERAKSGARFTSFGFGVGAPATLPDGAGADGPRESRAAHSDLGAALRALAASPEERPSAIVVVSDGRLDDPPESASATTLRALAGSMRVPIHTVSVAHQDPADASIRRVSAAGAAVAHVPLPLRVEVGCAGGLACDDVLVEARELRDDGPPVLLATGAAHLKDGKAALDLTITLEQAGARIVEVRIAPPAGDAIPANDTRLVTFQVTRERVRVLHVAGRPTSDVRTFRQWLKSDASVDVVAFFILRTPTDDTRATQNELALIPFPVDELFTEHLPSFDAVVLQDFDAQPYGLEKYLRNIENYVRGGGGLVMVGGQNSFVAGGYAGTPLAEVLPVGLARSGTESASDTSPFTPQWTGVGRAAPLMEPLRNLLGDELPEMVGCNVLGDARPGGVVLWRHPTRTTATGEKMPVLAVGEEGEGRTIALAVDGTWKLKFSQLSARSNGRGHGALWDGLLGWLMRDPRFEGAQMEMSPSCTAGLPSTLRVHLLPNSDEASPRPESGLGLEVRRMDRTEAPYHRELVVDKGARTVDVALPAMHSGAYTARLRTAGGISTRYDFACEEGGDEWADSRPDPDRLRALSRATGGESVSAEEAASLPIPKPTVVSAERHVTPVAPPWVWSLAAAVLLGVHWIARRRSGLS